MSRYGKAETLAIAAAVLFSVLFFALVAYLGWAEATANTIILVSLHAGRGKQRREPQMPKILYR